ncbi:MAG: HEAT repeat domain-containing protein [Vicinamibacterales bacterium]
MPEPVPAPLHADEAARLAEFARACKSAARAVSLYPGAHPAIGVSLERLAEITQRLTQSGPFRVQVSSDRLLVNGGAAAKPDPAIAELAGLLHRHLIGGLTLNPGADAGSWRTLLLLLARTPEEVRADGGIARLWSTAGGPSVEIQQIDYAEVLREKEGKDAALEEIIAAALAGPTLQLDDSGMRLLLEILGDSTRLAELMNRLETATATGMSDAAAAFLSLVRGLTEWTSRHQPEKLETVLSQASRAAGRLSADSMLSLLAQRQRADHLTGDADAASAVVDRMTDSTVSEFVAQSVIAERGASERLAQAFQTLVPDTERQRQLLALAEAEVSSSELGNEEGFADLWQRVEGILTSYSDKTFVSDEYGRELTTARAQAVDVERISDDPPERLVAWLATVNDAALRGLDDQLLLDLLVIEADLLRWRDVADTVTAHAEDLVRAGQFETACRLGDAVVRESRKEAARLPHARSALERFARGAMMKHVAAHLRVADEETYERFKTLCHAIGPPVITPLAEVLSAERDARSRRRLRDVLIGFGAQGRESVQPLMSAPNWEVRRTAAFLLREFGGSEGLKELVPLLADNEPLVQREAIQALLLNGSEDASQILLNGIRTTSGRVRETLVTELTNARDARSAPFFRHVVRHMDRRTEPRLYVAAIEALGAINNQEAIEALRYALYQGDWRTPFETRRIRSAAAAALRRIGAPPAIEVLREASRRGNRGVRAAARDAMTGMD